MHSARKGRHSIRLSNYDYSQAGLYFLTICMNNRKCIFGDIINGKIKLNKFGDIVEREWIKSSIIRDEISLDEWVIMPNHFHGIVNIKGHNKHMGDPPVAPTTSGKPNGPNAHSIGSLVAGFKSSVTTRINKILGTPGKKLWQRNYWEHIIRNEQELNRIRLYIIENPQNWQQDRLNINNENVVSDSYSIYCYESWMV